MARSLALLSLVLSLAFFLILKSYALTFDVGDEWIYHLQAVLTAQGAVPYRDYFLAHPPLGTFLPAALYAVFGFSLPLAKAIPIASAALTGIFVFMIARRTGGWIAAAVATPLLLFSYDELRASTHFTGTNLATLLLTLALLLRVLHVPFAMGAAAAAALATRLIVAPLVFVTIIEGIFGNRHGRRRVILGAAAVVIAVTLPLLLIVGPAPLRTQLISYHWAKTGMPEAELRDTLVQLAYHNVWILALGLLGAARALGEALRAWIWRLNLTEARSVLSTLFAPVALLHLLALLSLSRAYAYYILPALPSLAILGGTVCADAAASLRRGIRDTQSRPRAWRTFALCCAVVVTTLLVRSALHRRIDYVQRRSDEAKTYTWSPTPLPAAIDAMVQWAFWRNPRSIAQSYSAITQYLWHESRHFDAVPAIAEAVRTLSTPQDTIFGDSTTTSLIALLTGRRIAGSEVDTNAQRFDSGISDLEGLLHSLEEDPPRLLLTQPGAGIDSLAAFRRYREAHYTEAERFSDATTSGRSYVLWVRREDDLRPPPRLSPSP